MWITQKEASELSGKSLKAINEMVRAGKLPVKSQYGKRLVRKADVENFRRGKKELIKNTESKLK